MSAGTFVREEKKQYSTDKKIVLAELVYKNWSMTQKLSVTKVKQNVTPKENESQLSAITLKKRTA